MPSNYPDIIATSVTFSRVSNTQTFTSPFVKTVQTVGFSGSLWKASIQHEHLNKTEYNELYAFLLSLRGRAGRFYLSPIHYEVSLPIGLTASNVATTVTLSAPAVDLVVGNYVSINHELRMVISKTSDLIFDVDQPFRTNYVAQAIELNNPDCLMMLANDELDMIYRGIYFSDVTVDCIEALS